MLYGERWEDPLGMIKSALRGNQARIWTSMPGIVQTPIASDGTVSIKLSLQGVVRLPSGKVVNVNYPMLQKCPVQFASGGGFYYTHPVMQGDEVLVVFSSRCIDSWWQQGGVQPPLVLRMHALSDGFCIPGISSAPNALPNVSQTSIQLRSKTVVMMDVTASQITMNVPLVVNSTIVATGDVTGAGNTLNHHIHTDAGGDGDSGPPVPGT
jgi:phage baseplate assembly protein gpV